MKQNHKTKLKAIGLFEIIIALGIISTTIIVSISSLLGTAEGMRQNEIGESSNFILLKSIELARSPSEITVIGEVGLADYYAIENLDGQAFRLRGVNQTNTNCDQESIFLASNILENPSNHPICLRISITPIIDAISNKEVYIFNSEVFYSYKSENISQSASAIRYGPIISI